MDYFNIRIDCLLPDKCLPFDLFLEIGGKPLHYLRPGGQLSPEKLKNLQGSNRVFVPVEQRQIFKDFLHEQLKMEGLDSRAKAHILRESALFLVGEIYENSDVGQALERSEQLIQEFINFMGENPKNMSHLISLSAHDFYTYNHSLDVSIYSLGLGRVLGYKPKDLLDLGQGALFHDVGKKWVDVEIIGKKGPLNEVEWEQMKKHPEFGLKILEDQEVSEAVIACCYEHHESFLGNGYPRQLSGQEIHPMAGIVAVSDTYDALTTQRSYNQPLSPKEAVDFMGTHIQGRYSPHLLQILQKALGFTD